MGMVGDGQPREILFLCKSVLSRRDCGGKNAAVGIGCEVAGPET